MRWALRQNLEMLHPDRLQTPWQSLLTQLERQTPWQASLRELENSYVEYERYFDGGSHFVKEKDQKFNDLVRRIKDIQDSLIAAGQRPLVQALLQRRKTYLAQLKNKNQRG